MMSFLGFVAATALMGANHVSGASMTFQLPENDGLSLTDRVDPAVLKDALQRVAELEAKRYNCSVSISVKDAKTRLSVASGTSNFDTGRQAEAEDAFAWGSGTKPLTGASILHLISKGYFDLNSTASSIVDPYLEQLAKNNKKQNFTSLQDLYGPDVTKVTIRQLLAMQSGIPDFDTAVPYPLPPTDALRADLYAHKNHSLSPIELMQVPWVAIGHLVRPSYSSTNFVILGLILARIQGAASWEDLKQLGYMSEAGKQEFNGIGFALDLTKGPVYYTEMHGYDRTTYNNNTKQIDTGEVAGDFAGYTASDVIMSSGDAATLAWQVYGPNPTVAPWNISQLMIPDCPAGSNFRNCFYGLATFNLTDQTGQPGPLGRAWGHLGATYGYQSIMSYHPALNIAMAVATNIETDDQIQPSDTICIAFNTVAALVLNKNYTCEYSTGGYYGGFCNCTNVA